MIVRYANALRLERTAGAGGDVSRPLNPVRLMNRYANWLDGGSQELLDIKLYCTVYLKDNQESSPHLSIEER